MGNPTQLHQITMNLCTNAAHAIEDAGGQLTITIKNIDYDNIAFGARIKLSRANNYAQLQVADTGAGIAPEIIDSIFEPYFATKKPGEGTDMGLAMVQGTVKSYGGNIGVESIVDKGRLHDLFSNYRPKHTPARVWTSGLSDRSRVGTFD